MKIFIIFCAIWASVQSARDLSKIFKDISCQPSDPDLDACLLNGVRKSLPTWLKGIPEIGIPPMDPLLIPKLSVDQIMQNVMNFTSTFTNVEVTGFRNTKINSLKVDPVNLYGSIRISIPWVHIVTDYSINGNFAIMPIENRGHFEGNFTDINMYMKASLKTYKKDDGLKYFKLNKLHQNITIGDGHIKMDSKDKQFQRTVEMVSEFFNGNAANILDAFSPFVSKNSEKMTQELVDNILSNLPISNLVL